MRKMYNTKRLLGTVACATAMFAAAPMIAQEVVETQEIELFDPAKAAKSGQQVEVGETGQIELHVKELEITKVLQLLSIQSKRNIIASRGVENSKVSADLYGVDFYDALKSILEPNGFGYVEEGNFIYVLTKDELAKREADNRKMITKIHTLSYLRADEAAGFVTPMLSDNGSIAASGKVEDGIDPGIDNAGADNYAGPPTLVIRDYEDSVESIISVLDQLDVQPKQVIIEATVLQAKLTENNQFGVDFSLFTDLTGASPLDIVDGAISGGQPNGKTLLGGQSTVGNVGGQPAGGVKLGFVAGDAAVFVSALDSVTDTTVIATPKVTVLDRNRTSILVGQKVAYLSTTQTETSSTETVEFLEVGTQLNVRPFVSKDGKVRLELRPSVSSAEIRTIGTTDAPDESTVELTTNVIVESGQTIVLGGLFTESSTVDRNQVPGLGNVPIIGAAFQGHSDSVDRSEVIFMVKATVVENQTLVDLGKEGMARTDAARLAEREQLLPWSRSKLTSAHMVNARKYYDESMTLTGEEQEKKIAKALYCVDMALHMNPSMVDALLLKEKITGEAAYIKYEESIVNETYDAVLNAEMKALGVNAAPAEATPDKASADKTNALIEPETVSAQEKPAATQAEADEAWLDAVVEEELAPEAKTQEAAEEETVAEVTEEQPTDSADVEVVEETADGSDSAWRELSTAELLQQAAEATETDNSTANTETETE